MAKKKTSKPKSKPQVSKALQEALKYVPAKQRKAIEKRYSLETKQSAVRKRAVTRKKKLKLPPVIKSSIVRRKNKRGNVYYYNKRKHKRSTAKSWKQSRARVRERAQQIHKIKTRKPKELTQYNKVQKILGDYARSKGLKLGKEFNKYASNIYKGTKNVDSKYIEQNIEQLVENFSGFRAEVPTQAIKFETEFPFYYAVENLNDTKYDGVRIRVTMNDPAHDFFAEFVGSNDEFAQWWTTSGTYHHCREYYNGSPVAMFVLQDSDYKTFVVYTIEALGEGEIPAGITMPAGAPPAPIAGLPLSSPEPAPKKETKAEKRARIKRDSTENKKSRTKLQKRQAEYIATLKSVGFTDSQLNGHLEQLIERDKKRTGKTDTAYILGLFKQKKSASEVDKIMEKRKAKDKMYWMKNQITYAKFLKQKQKLDNRTIKARLGLKK